MLLKPVMMIHPSKAASSSHLVTSIHQKHLLVNLKLGAPHLQIMVPRIQKQNHLQRHQHLLAKHLQVHPRKFHSASHPTSISMITTSTRTASILMNVRVTTNPSIPAGRRRKSTNVPTVRGKAGQSMQGFPIKCGPLDT